MLDNKMVESIVHRIKEICWIKLRMVTFILQLFCKNRIRTVEWREVAEPKKRDLTREIVHTLLICNREDKENTEDKKICVPYKNHTSRKFENEAILKHLWPPSGSPFIHSDHNIDGYQLSSICLQFWHYGKYYFQFCQDSYMEGRIMYLKMEKQAL